MQNLVDDFYQKLIAIVSVVLFMGIQGMKWERQRLEKLEKERLEKEAAEAPPTPAPVVCEKCGK